MKDEKSQFKILREKYPKFVYKNCFYKLKGRNLEISFVFYIEPDITFKPKIIIENVDKKKLAQIGDSALNNLIFHLGLAEIPSYWKATCSPEIKIEIRFVSMEKEQIKWWKDLMIQGMGQFFYENKINFKKQNFLKITPINTNSNFTKFDLVKFSSAKLSKDKKENRVLVPIGGGKDSIVTLKTLKKIGKNLNCFSLNPTKAAKKIMKIGDCKKPIIVRRKIDKKLLELNRQGFLNGHTPFSSYLAFLSILIAAIFGQKYIAFSQERSSNEGNLKYLNRTINHQWSKNFNFEKKFRNYTKKYLTEDINYFSFLRPLYEIQIARLFSRCPEYFSAFLSCNEAHKTASGTKKPAKKWCGNCSKCLFVFTTLYPFINKKRLLKIFGKNLFENKKLLLIMRELIGERGFKPFECVGTEKESLTAFYLSWKKYRDQKYRDPLSVKKKYRERVSVKLPFLLKHFEKKILPKYPNLEKDSVKILNSWNNQHNLPKEFEKALKKMVS